MKKVATKSYKLWVSIEEHIIYEDGSDEYNDDAGGETRSVGEFNTLQEAEDEMNMFGDTHQNNTFVPMSERSEFNGYPDLN
jgi:hypothetical protein